MVARCASMDSDYCAVEDEGTSSGRGSITSRREDDLMPRFETEMEVCPDCRRATEAMVEYIRDSDGNVVRRLVRDINCRYADCPGSEVPPHWS